MRPSTFSSGGLPTRSRIAMVRVMMRGLAKTVLGWFGWQAEGNLPEGGKFVLIAAPHTSNWDMPVMLGLAMVYGIKVHWLGKHTLFAGPMGPLMRALGGIPVVRHERQNLVQQVAELFRTHESFILAVPPEGTRKRVEHWKSGFYHMARAANVPILLGFLDYGRKRGGFGRPVQASADPSKVMDEIRAFYRDKAALRPEFFAEPRLRDEAAAEPAIGAGGASSPSPKT